jgi:hypothetical protein
MQAAAAVVFITAQHFQAVAQAAVVMVAVMEQQMDQMELQIWAAAVEAPVVEQRLIVQAVQEVQVL